MMWKVIVIYIWIIETACAINMTYDTSPLGPSLHVNTQEQENSTKFSPENPQREQGEKGRMPDVPRNGTTSIEAEIPFDIPDVI